ncbi:MAG: hypothetical protein NTZ67_02685 [Gammaproteobacteria bacterium]|nr:hypothetical protein [Gammaproteobacteria bacterium]
MLSPDCKTDTAAIHWCLIDLGIAWSTNDWKSQKKRGKGFMGTIPYISPEAMILEQNYFARDIWALGYLLREFIVPQNEVENMFQSLKRRTAQLSAEKSQCLSTFSCDDIPGGLYFDTEEEKQTYFRLVEKSLLLPKLLFFLKGKGVQDNFIKSLSLVLDAMLNTQFESRPSISTLKMVLPILATQLPAQRPNNYGEKDFIARFRLWETKEIGTRRQSEFSLHSNSK